MRYRVKMKSDESLKRKLPIRARENDLVGLRVLGRRLKAVQRNTFRKKYGNSLSVLDVEVHIPMITTFVQYYDLLIRAFTFQDIQLVPTLEECENILNLPLEGKVPYKYIDIMLLSQLWLE